MIPDRHERDPATRCVRSAVPTPGSTQPLVAALDASVVYRVDSLEQVDAVYEGRQPGYVYARDGHPNLTQLCRKVAELEDAQSAWAGSSGMAAEAAAMLDGLCAGDRVALADGVYGKTERLVELLGRLGIAASRFDSTRPNSLRAALTSDTRLVFVESISNPLLQVADIAALAAEAERVGARLIVDHTFAPLLFRPLELGAHLVTHSATKLIGGHSDLTLGLVAGSKADIDSIAATGSTLGMTANPYECWLCARGLATLAIRVERSNENAFGLAERLEKDSRVVATHYPGLTRHPDHATAARQFRGGFGSILTIDLGGRERAGAFIRALAASIPFAPSLGDVATTLSHPASTSHRGLSPERRQQQGIHAGLVRISVGLESLADLWSELSAALKRLDA